MTNLNFEYDSCDLCGSLDLLLNKEEGSLVCKNCGNVVANNLIDHDREWRIFFGEEKSNSARTGAPVKLSIHDKGITTEIKSIVKEGINYKELERMRILSIYQQRVRVSNSKERNFYNAFQLLDRVSVKLGFPEDVKETAASLYRKAIEMNPRKGKSIKGLLAACIYAASKYCGYPLKIKEIMNELNVRSRTFSKYYNEILSILPKESTIKLKSNYTLNFLPELVKKLNLNAEVEIVSKNIINKALESGMIAGKSPLSLAAAAVYIACSLTNNKRTQREIAECAGVTEVTIRNRSKELIRSLDISINL